MLEDKSSLCKQFLSLSWLFKQGPQWLYLQADIYLWSKKGRWIHGRRRAKSPLHNLERISFGRTRTYGNNMIYRAKHRISGSKEKHILATSEYPAARAILQLPDFLRLTNKHSSNDIHVLMLHCDGMSVISLRVPKTWRRWAHTCAALLNNHAGCDIFIITVNRDKFHDEILYDCIRPLLC